MVNKPRRCGYQLSLNLPVHIIQTMYAYASFDLRDSQQAYVVGTMLHGTHLQH